jgi:hypothetical protein
MKHSFLETIWPLLLLSRDSEFRIEFADDDDLALYDFCLKSVDTEATGIDEDMGYFELTFSKDEVTKAKEVWEGAEEEDLPRMIVDTTYIYRSNIASDYKFLLKLAAYICLQKEG